MGLWQPSCLIWKHLRFHGWGVVSSASGSGPQMDYSKSNHNTWIWDAFRARECSLLFFFFATFCVRPSSSVYHPSSFAHHRSLPISASVASLTQTFCSGFKKAKDSRCAKICRCNNHSIVIALAYINNVKQKSHWLICACPWNVITWITYKVTLAFNANSD